MQEVQRPGASQTRMFAVVLAVGTAAALLVLHGNFSQLEVLQVADFNRAIVAAGLAGIVMVVFANAAIQFIESMSGYELSDVLEGHEAVSFRWGYVALFGILMGAGVAFFSRLAVVVLPLLPAHPFLP